MTNTLKLVLTDHWFEEIKSGRKTHEYREASSYWYNRIKSFVEPCEDFSELQVSGRKYVEFQKAYRENPERMTFEIKSIHIVLGENTDLNINKMVYDIELGERIN